MSKDTTLRVRNHYGEQDYGGVMLDAVVEDGDREGDILMLYHGEQQESGEWFVKSSRYPDTVMFE